jgi:flagellar basal body-associated protein FliL
MPNRKKPLILFIVFVVLLIIAKMAYTKYCESKPESCKNQVNGKEKYNEKQGLAEEKVDW